MPGNNLSIHTIFIINATGESYGISKEKIQIDPSLLRYFHGEGNKV
jgi:hypothetical protein